jgi:hypothetical protein
MALSDYQVDAVIKAYLKNMTIRAASANDDGDTGEIPEDRVAISEEAMKVMFFKRIRKSLAKKLTKHNP